MKRYRVLGFDFDSGPSILRDLRASFDPTWSGEAQVRWRAQHDQQMGLLAARFGSRDLEFKAGRYIELGNAPFSIIAQHNRFLRQIREAYVLGAFYPALTAACSLGERLLNHLLLLLRDDFKGTEEYKRVYRKQSFDDWAVAIDVLTAWGVFREAVSTEYRRLHELRNRAIHFRPEVDRDDQALALAATQAISTIVELQFGAVWPKPWYIDGVPGEIYVKSSSENEPFVARIIVPNCVLCGPSHRIEAITHRGMTVIDDGQYDEATTIDDDEFVRLRLAYKASN